MLAQDQNGEAIIDQPSVARKETEADRKAASEANAKLKSSLGKQKTKRQPSQEKKPAAPKPALKKGGKANRKREPKASN